MFFDIENIFGGYGEGFSKRVASVSLADIEGQIAAACSEPTGAFAVKRAYADWSQPALRTLRKTVVEQGIEPRQVFGFGQGGKTNAADIELVIDVLELLYSRDEVLTYVIVSGDGGFGSLVRKLHEFGRQAIVAGYADRSSGALRAVCDQFVVLSALRPPTAAAEGSATPARDAGTRSIDLIRAAAGPAPPLPVSDHNDLLEAGTGFMATITADSACVELLDKEGLLLTQLASVLKSFVAPEEIKSTFRGLAPFLSEILEGSDWVVATGSAGQPARIVRRESAAADVVSSSRSGVTLSETDRKALTAAAKGDPRKLPGALAPILISMLDSVDGDSLEIHRVTHAATGTGLREAAQGFFGTTTRLFRVALAGTDLCVTQSKSDPTRNSIRSRIEFDEAAATTVLLDDLSLPTDVELAQAILKQAHLRLPGRADVNDVVKALERMPLNDGESLNELISRLVESDTLPAAVELSALRQMLAVLLQVEVFTGPSRRDADWLEPPARQEISASAEMLERLQASVEEVLRPYELDRAEVLEELLPIGSDVPE